MGSMDGEGGGEDRVTIAPPIEEEFVCRELALSFGVVDHCEYDHEQERNVSNDHGHNL